MAVDSAKKHLNRSVGILVTGMSAAEMETKLGRFGLPLTFIAESTSIIYPPSNSLFCAEDAFVLLFAFCVRSHCMHAPMHVCVRAWSAGKHQSFPATASFDDEYIRWAT